MPPLRSLRLPASVHSTSFWLAIAGTLTILACEEDKAPTAPAAAAAQAVAATPDAVIGATPQGTIPLPINQPFNGTGLAFGITQTGTGPNASFRINNAANTRDALLAQTNGTGYALHAIASGNAAAAKFENTKIGTGQNTLFAIANGPGNVISAVNLGGGPAGLFTKTATTGTTSALLVQNAGPGRAVEGRANGSGYAGYFENTGVNNVTAALRGLTRGLGIAGHFTIDNASNDAEAVFSSTNGTGWAARFKATSRTGKGVVIETNGGDGLLVAGGTKNALVTTATGARALYTEESSEVWFTDYGFGKLENGRARILIDPGFAQTVSLEQPYHVFVQPYGRADLYVEARTDLGFVVALKDGDPSAEFGYRVVAKRSGFEKKRLERAPWADNSPAFQVPE
jgi:hypothetical protein